MASLPAGPAMRRLAPSLSACSRAISALKRRIAARTSSNHNEEAIPSALLPGSNPVAKKVLSSAAPKADANGQTQQDGSASRGALVADIIIANAPDPVFVSDLEGKILQANDAVSELLGFRKDEVVEQSLSRFISAEETQEFTAALREVVERGVTRDAVLNPRSAAGEVIPTTLNASALRDADGNVIGAIGILRDMRAYEEVVRDLERSKTDLQEKILDLEKFEEVVVGRELKMIALEKELESLQRENEKLKAARASA